MAAHVVAPALWAGMGCLLSADTLLLTTLHLYNPHGAQVGDLRPYLCGFFDTTSGPKGESSSYK